ncbi:hydrolase, alpha/beta hydrolase fold family [Novosphingobium sp. Rr 2-17]|nr:hydrolase, alpha/beta hydrolase fold family [Novosphingobium sp. Rr 2-17]
MPKLVESNTDAPTRLLETNGETYAYRRFGTGDGPPLLFLQHFTGTLDNWDPAVTGAIAERREIILFDNAGIGRSSGTVPATVAGMAAHALAFLDGLGLVDQVDVLGFSLGGMVAQQMVLDRPSIFRKIILVGTAPRGGEEIMQLDKPSLGQHFSNPELKGYDILQKIFFTPSAASQDAGAAFIERLMQRREDRDPPSDQEAIQAQMASFREWEQPHGERFSELAGIAQPVLVINGIADEMIPVRNSYWLAENIPNATLMVLPDAGHGSLFQYHRIFADHVDRFLGSQTKGAPL